MLGLPPALGSLRPFLASRANQRGRYRPADEFMGPEASKWRM